MTKEKKLKLIKILSVVFWIVLLIFPTIYANIYTVTLLDDNWVYDSENEVYEFTFECDKEVVSGEMVIEFYDENQKLLKTVAVPFEDNKGKNVVVTVDYDNVPDDVALYKTGESTVKSKSVKNVETVLYPIAIVYVVWAVYISCINVASCGFNDKKVEVYTGIKKHTLKIDGEVADSADKFLPLKPITLVAYIGEGKKIIAEIKPNKRITIYSKDDPEYSTKELNQLEEKVEVAVANDVKVAEPVVETPVEPVVEEIPAPETEEFVRTEAVVPVEEQKDENQE